MASRFKNGSLAGTNGAAAFAWFNARRPSGMPLRRDDYRVGQLPCGPTVGGRGQQLAAAIEGASLVNRRQLKA